eukprot:scaffold43745_cov229-Amphora_coffeaeformis.AAC.1
MARISGGGRYGTNNSRVRVCHIFRPCFLVGVAWVVVDSDDESDMMRMRDVFGRNDMVRSIQWVVDQKNLVDRQIDRR